MGILQVLIYCCFHQNSHWILYVCLFIFSSSHLFMKIPCLLHPKLLIKHTEQFCILNVQGKGPADVSRTSRTFECDNNLLKPAHTNTNLQGGGVWAAWPVSASPGPVLSPSAAGSALLLASGRDPLSGCGSSAGLVSQQADPSSPFVPVLRALWPLPAPPQLPVYAHRAPSSPLLSGRETTLFHSEKQVYSSRTGLHD